MHTLFLKIFVWFWAATALVVISLVLVTEMTRSRRTDPPPFFTGTMTIYSESAVREFNRSGIDGLRKYLREIEEKAQVEAVLFDSGGNELIQFSAQNVPDAVKNYVSEKNNADQTQITPLSAGIFAIRRTQLPNNQSLILYTRFGRSPFDDLPYRSYALRILAVLLTAGLFCYWLAGYISAPVSKIRSATRQLADGDLSVRVSPLIGKRRDELANMGRDFDRMAERIESLMTAQWRLLRDISHELRSPLARLNIGLALARKRAGEGAESNSALERIEQETGLLNEMIDRLLELDRWEFGVETLLRERVDLALLLEDVAADADFEALDQNRRVVIAHSEKCYINGISTLLRSAIENIVRNAIRHTEEDTTVEINLKCRKSLNETIALITVRDLGTGVPEDAIDNIFQPFFRVDDARDRESGGTGLGLAIAERAIKLHGGTITALNDLEKGLIIEIRLAVESEHITK